MSPREIVVMSKISARLGIAKPLYRNHDSIEHNKSSSLKKNDVYAYILDLGPQDNDFHIFNSELVEANCYFLGDL